MSRRCSTPVRRSRHAAGLPVSLVWSLAHCPEIVFGVLEVILRGDPVPGKSFGAGQGEVAFIVSLGVLRVPRLRAAESRSFVSPAGS
jgi:hypothetical protein